MALQLKSDDSNMEIHENIVKTDREFDVENGNHYYGNKPTGGGEEDPWEYKGVKNRNNTISSEPMVNMELNDSRNGNAIVNTVVKIILAFIVVGMAIFGGKKIVSIVMPEGVDITEYVNKDEKDIANGLGITFSDNTEWVPQIHQWTNNGKVTVHSNEDIGVVYIDGKRMGLHIHTNKYRLYNIQIGMGEPEMNKKTTYKFDNFLSVLNDMAEGKTTTYYYFNNAQNDCIAVTINDTTNRVAGLTYFNDFNKVTESLE